MEHLQHKEIDGTRYYFWGKNRLSDEHGNIPMVDLVCTLIGAGAFLLVMVLAGAIQ